MMNAQARLSAGIMGFDTHMIWEPCLLRIPASEPDTRPLTSHHATMPRPWTLPHHNGRTRQSTLGPGWSSARYTAALDSPSYFLTELQRLFPLFRGQVSACPGMVLPHGSRG